MAMNGLQPGCGRELCLGQQFSVCCDFSAKPSTYEGPIAMDHSKKVLPPRFRQSRMICLICHLTWHLKNLQKSLDNAVICDIST